MFNRLVQFYESMGTRDFIQIGILAVVIYAVWRFVSKTCGSGSSIGRGLALVVLGLFLLAQVVAANLDMTELGIVLDYLLTTFLVGMLIIFQPELRRGLMRLGQSRVWLFMDRSEMPIADRLADAAKSMSVSNIGAIVVVERETDLSPLCESGQRIDAEISSSLLETIFTPRSPLHDGAVILQKGRVSAAACQLPLRPRDGKNAENHRTNLGMRHRAALCTSEETDAILLVVSEETGKISLAYRGVLEPVPRELLTDRLHKILNSAPLAGQRQAA